MKTGHISARRPSFRPLLEDALQVLKGPLHNPEAKDFKKIIFAMKNCSFFRESFSSQTALNDFVEVAKFYVGYKAYNYGDVILHDKEYADKLCIILDGTVEKIFQKPYGKVEEQIKERRRGMSFCGFDMTSLKGKTFLPSIKSPRISVNFGQNEVPTFAPPKRVSTPKTNSFSKQAKKIQRLPSQQRELTMSSEEEDEEGPVFEDLMKFIVKKNPEMKRKYYAEEILRADQVKTLITGDYFGESFCVSNHPKSNFMFAVSSSEAHLLTLNKEEYCEIMKQLENKNCKKLEAFLKLFPSFEKDYIQRFSEYFCQKNFQTDEVIYFQDTPAQDLYIMISGGVQLLRKPSAESRGRGGSSMIPIASVVKDQGFGEECLLFMENRQESAIANVSNTSVFLLKASLISEIEKEFEDILIELRKRAGEKFQWRQQKAKELFEKNENSSPSPSDSSPRRSLSPTKESKSLFSPRHSIQIPHRRSFLSEMSPAHSPSAANLAGSLASLFPKPTPRKLSDDQLQQQTRKSELFKSQFGRTCIISEAPHTTRAREKVNYPKLGDISPGSDLKTLNFRNELYGSPSNLKRSQLSSEKLKTVCNKHRKDQSSFSTMIIKRGIV